VSVVTINVEPHPTVRKKYANRRAFYYFFMEVFTYEWVKEGAGNQRMSLFLLKISQFSHFLTMAGMCAGSV